MYVRDCSSRRVCLEVGGEPKTLAKAGELRSLLEDFRQYVGMTIIYRSEF